VSKPIGLEEQVRCVARELALRQRLYPQWVQQGKMTRRTAEHETAAMAAVLGTLRREAEGVRPGLFSESE
jgi:hypothetical protein